MDPFALAAVGLFVGAAWKAKSLTLLAVAATVAAYFFTWTLNR